MTYLHTIPYALHPRGIHFCTSLTEMADIYKLAEENGEEMVAYDNPISRSLGFCVLGTGEAYMIRIHDLQKTARASLASRTLKASLPSTESRAAAFQNIDLTPERLERYLCSGVLSYLPSEE